jgi:hypothetical protein
MSFSLQFIGYLEFIFNFRVEYRLEQRGCQNESNVSAQLNILIKKKYSHWKTKCPTTELNVLWRRIIAGSNFQYESGKLSIIALKYAKISALVTSRSQKDSDSSLYLTIIDLSITHRKRKQCVLCTVTYLR